MGNKFKLALMLGVGVSLASGATRAGGGALDISDAF